MNQIVAYFILGFTMTVLLSIGAYDTYTRAQLEQQLRDSNQVSAEHF